MSFDYDRHKHHQSQDSMWTSYSDLFLGLSIIFLLLYVTSSLRQGTDGIKQVMENQRLAKEAEDLKQQIKVYETLKKDYLANEATVDEQANYQELMDKLSLLQGEASEEKTKLRLQAQENEKKEQALNKYQQMIRNIVNSNMIAKSRIKSRDTMITDKEEIITEKSATIKTLEGSVQAKTQEIERGESRISGLESQLDQRMKQLRQAYTSQKISKQAFQKQQEAIKQDTESKIQALRMQNALAQKELDEASRELQATSSKLEQTEGNLAKVGEEKAKLEGELQGVSAKHQADINRLKGEYDAQKARERAAFEAQLAKEKLSGSERAAREARFKADAEKKAQGMAAQLADMDRKYKDSQGALAKAQENLNARKNLAAQIAKNLAASGVGAEVDPNNGDVLLSFDGQYFDTGKADLKPGMRKILESAMPAYSNSLFQNPKIANKIQSVEIVGFASPTYKGKYVDPSSLNPEDRQAVNFNLDLSYARARSIFNHVFDKEKMAFTHQKQLLPLVKVTGRSFLTTDKNKAPSDASTESFCRTNDCAKLQRVVIKFTLKD